jgi:hypothetical protein
MITSSIISPPLTIPPLENGDKLTRAEFERRYEAMPQVKKAELKEGENQLLPKVQTLGSAEVK